MSALLIVRDDDGAIAEQPGDSARESLARQGFRAPRSRGFAGGTVHWYATPDNPDRDELLQDIDDEGGFVACVGTLFYRGLGGGPALRELWHDFTVPDALGWDTLWGNYLLVVAKANRLWVFGDPVGTIRLYRTGDERVWSSSWLACADSASTRELDPIGTIDYVMSGANHGDRTPLRGVRIADPGRAFELTANTSRALAEPGDWTGGAGFSSMSRAVDAAAAILGDRAATISRGFGPRIRSALSGGFDSRLIVAALRSAGATPRLHVYGTPGDEDVRIASQAARAIGFAIEHIDKSELDRALPEPDEAHFARQCAFFDGIPIDGVFDRGADRLTRVRQSADGFVALNGGGGEIMRNFFYLHDRPFCAAQVVRAFYSNWLAAAVRSRADRRAYFDYMVDAIERSVGASGTMPRATVELIYPLFRVRYWMGRNNSIAARSGDFLTPLVDPELVRLSHSLMLSWKDYGRFEAALLTRLDPELAAVALSYGFTPRDGPGWGYRTQMWLQQHRPPWLREKSARVRAWLRASRPGGVAVDAHEYDPAAGPTAGCLRSALLDNADQRARAATLDLLMR